MRPARGIENGGRCATGSLNFFPTSEGMTEGKYLEAPYLLPLFLQFWSNVRRMRPIAMAGLFRSMVVRDRGVVFGSAKEFDRNRHQVASYRCQNKQLVGGPTLSR